MKILSNGCAYLTSSTEPVTDDFTTLTNFFRDTLLPVTAAYLITGWNTSYCIYEKYNEFELNFEQLNRFSLTVISLLFLGINFPIFVDFDKITVSRISKFVAYDPINTICFQSLHFNTNFTCRIFFDEKHTYIIF